MRRVDADVRRLILHGEGAHAHTPAPHSRHVRWLCRIMPPSVPFISACRAVYPIDQRRSSSQHFRFQSEALVYGDEIGNVFFTQPFEERPTKARDMTMQRRTWRATLHTAL